MRFNHSTFLLWFYSVCESHLQGILCLCLKLFYLQIILPGKQFSVQQLDEIHRTLSPLNLSPFWMHKVVPAKDCRSVVVLTKIVRYFNLYAYCKYLRQTSVLNGKVLNGKLKIVVQGEVLAQRWIWSLDQHVAH